MSTQAAVLPPDEALAQSVVALRQYKPDPRVQAVINEASEVRINSHPMAEKAARFLGMVGDLIKTTKERWKDPKGSAHAHWKLLVAKENEELEPLLILERKLKDGINAFDAELRRREQEALRKEQERVLAEQRALEEATAEELVEQEGLPVEEAQEVAKQIAAEMPVPQPVVQHRAIAGAATRVSLKADVVSILDLVKAIAADPMRFPTTLLQVNQTQLNNYVKAHGADVQIPGVKVSRVSSVYRR